MRPWVLVLAAAGLACGDDSPPSTAAPDAGGPPVPGGVTEAGDPAGRVARENALPGTTAWRLGQPAGGPEIEGYPLQPGAAAGDTVGIAVSTRPASAYTWEVYRVGHYGGRGGRLMARGGPLAGEAWPVPTPEPGSGRVEARWPTAFEVPTRDAAGRWPTGVYLVKLQREDGVGSYAIFVLRDDSRDAEVAVKLPTETWQAYNRWGGDSLYESASRPGDKARAVSFDRPYEAGLGFGSGTFFSLEAPTILWLEERGYDVEYLIGADVAAPGARVGAHRLVVALAHDEYTTMDALERMSEALGRGTSLAFLTGNTYFWQVRYQGPRDLPTLVCFKDRTDEDPLLGVDDAHVATAFARPPVNRPESWLLGVRSEGDASADPAPWRVRGASHWVYEGTGVEDGDAISDLVGFEWDRLLPDPDVPDGLTVLAESPIEGSVHNATIYERGGAFVFAAGTIYFGRGLARDERVARMMENLLARAGAAPRTP